MCQLKIYTCYREKELPILYPFPGKHSHLKQISM